MRVALAWVGGLVLHLLCACGPALLLVGPLRVRGLCLLAARLRLLARRLLVVGRIAVGVLYPVLRLGLCLGLCLGMSPNRCLRLRSLPRCALVGALRLRGLKRIRNADARTRVVA